MPETTGPTRSPQGRKDGNWWWVSLLLFVLAWAVVSLWRTPAPSPRDASKAPSPSADRPPSPPRRTASVVKKSAPLAAPPAVPTTRQTVSPTPALAPRPRVHRPEWPHEAVDLPPLPGRSPGNLPRSTGGADPAAPSQAEQAQAASEVTVAQLTQWIATQGLEGIAALRDANVDDDTYDRAILAALLQMSGTRGEDAAALFADFVANGRMDALADPVLYDRAVLAAKQLGVSLGARDYPSAVGWGFAFPAGSAAQAYVLSNVAFSQSRGAAMPELPWVDSVPAGFARARVVAAVAYGRLLANGDADLQAEVKQQLDRDELNPARLSAIVQQSTLPPDEQQTLLALLRSTGVR